MYECICTCACGDQRRISAGISFTLVLRQDLIGLEEPQDIRLVSRQCLCFLSSGVSRWIMAPGFFKWIL